MQINIKCNLQEYTDMIRSCTLARERRLCGTCVFLTEDGCAGVEDTANIEIVEGGAGNG